MSPSRRRLWIVGRAARPTFSVAQRSGVRRTGSRPGTATSCVSRPNSATALTIASSTHRATYRPGSSRPPKPECPPPFADPGITSASRPRCCWHGALRLVRRYEHLRNERTRSNRLVGSTDTAQNRPHGREHYRSRQPEHPPILDHLAQTQSNLGQVRRGSALNRLHIDDRDRPRAATGRWRRTSSRERGGRSPRPMRSNCR